MDGVPPVPPRRQSSLAQLPSQAHQAATFSVGSSRSKRRPVLPVSSLPPETCFNTLNPSVLNNTTTTTTTTTTATTATAQNPSIIDRTYGETMPRQKHRGKHRKSFSDLFRPKSRDDSLDRGSTSAGSLVEPSLSYDEEMKSTLHEISRRLNGLPVDLLFQLPKQQQQQPSEEEILTGLDSANLLDVEERLKASAFMELPDIQWILQEEPFLSHEFLALISAMTRFAPLDPVPLQQLISIKNERDKIVAEIEHVTAEFEKESKFRRGSLRLLKLYSSKTPISMSTSNSSASIMSTSSAAMSNGASSGVGDSGKFGSFRAPPLNISRPIVGDQANTSNTSSSDPNSSSPNIAAMLLQQPPSYTPHSNHNQQQSSQQSTPLMAAIQATTEAYFRATNAISTLSHRLLDLHRKQQDLDRQLMGPVFVHWLKAYAGLKRDHVQERVERRRCEVQIELMQQRDGGHEPGTSGNGYTVTTARTSSLKHEKEDGSDPHWMWMLRDDRTRALCEELVRVGGNRYRIRRESTASMKTTLVTSGDVSAVANMTERASSIAAGSASLRDGEE